MKAIFLILMVSFTSFAAAVIDEPEFDHQGRPWFQKYFDEGRVHEITGLKVPPGWRHSKDSHFLDIQPSPDLPKSFDLRELHPSGQLQPIKRQKCGDCWAHSVIAVLESNWALKHPTEPFAIFAQQELISTCPNTGGGCNGGYYGAFDYALGKTGPGLPMETDIPYQGTTTSCNKTVPKKARGIKWWYVGNRTDARGPSIAQMKQALHDYGSLAVTVYAFSHTGPSIYTNCQYGSINHMVNIEGWHDFETEEDKKKYRSEGYWLVRNSWGESFGEKGYAKALYTDRYGRKCNNLGQMAGVAMVE